MDQEIKKPSAREPRALSPEYHKAHKQVLLWSGILLIWELVGIDLTKVENAGGNVGAIVSAIKSPQAVPWVFLLLVAYSLFKFTIEWYQCSPDRRAIKVARIDFVSVWFISMLAYVLYVGQTIGRLQVADLLQDRTRMTSLFLGFSVGAMVSFFVVSFVGLDRLNRKALRHFIIRTSIALSLAFVVTLLLFRLGSVSLKVTFIAMIAGSFIVLGSVLILRSLKPGTILSIIPYEPAHKVR